MSELDPLGSPTELQTLLDTDPSPEGIAANLPTAEPKRGRPAGSKNRQKISYEQRIEDLISALNALIEKGELTATIERAYNRQIEYFQFQIQRRDDAKKESRDRRIAELEAKVTELNNPAPAVPSAPAQTDPETERRLNKMLKQLEAAAPEVNPDTSTKIDDHQRGLAVETPKPKPTEPKLSAEELAADLAKQEHDKAEIARIDKEYKQIEATWRQPVSQWLHPDVVQHRTDEYYRVHPELRPSNYMTPEERREERRKMKDAPAGFIEEQKRENARVQREYQAEYNFLRSGMQISPPSSLLPPEITERRFRKDE